MEVVEVIKEKWITFYNQDGKSCAIFLEAARTKDVRFLRYFALDSRVVNHLWILPQSRETPVTAICKHEAFDLFSCLVWFRCISGIDSSLMYQLSTWLFVAEGSTSRYWWGDKRWSIILKIVKSFKHEVKKNWISLIKIIKILFMNVLVLNFSGSFLKIFDRKVWVKFM